MDVIERYTNAGPFVLDALVAAEDLLRSSGKEDRVVALYESTWAKCQKPGEMAEQFVTQSNWYCIGDMLAERLDKAGQKPRAQSVRAELETVVGTPK
jgi:hypothetical protein